jgi:nucleotide-binding universal stress UspA family protein
MQTLLVPVDGSPNSTHAVQYAGEIAKSTAGTKLLLLNVQQQLARRYLHGLHNQSARLHLRKRGEEETAEARSFLDGSGCAYDFLIVFGSPAEVITQVAREKHCSAIVMGSRGFGRVKQFLFGSVSDAVRRSASVPVTLVT